MSDDLTAAHEPVGIISSKQFIADPMGWIEHAIRHGPVLVTRPGGAPFAVITPPSIPPPENPERRA